jgi:transposase
MSKQATWKRRVAEWRASGLTAAEFAAGRDFAPATLSWWAWRLGSGALPERRAADGPRPAGFIRVVTARPVPAVDESPLVVEIGVARVRVARGVDRDVFETVVAVLAAHARGGA